MPVVDRKSVFYGRTVSEAMRRLVVQLPGDSSIEQAIRYTIKFKVNAVLITDDHHRGVGVVSKTDLMGAYYAGLSIETPLEAIMVGPPFFCHVDDSLESSLGLMRTHGIHRLYVFSDEPEIAVGVLAYPDIVGLLYRFCRKCERSINRPRGMDSAEKLSDRLTIGEVMTQSVLSNREDENLLQIMESLSTHHLGAVLILSGNGAPAGVLSKTDLMVAYRHGVPAEGGVKGVMSAPVRALSQTTLLDEAIRHMIFSDIHRLFVYKEHPQNIVGVLSLSDAARVRSGSCRACVPSRIKIENGP